MAWTLPGETQLENIYSLRYLPTIRRRLVSDLSNFLPDWHFLPPDVWPPYTNVSKQQEDKGLQVDPEGPW